MKSHYEPARRAANARIVFVALFLLALAVMPTNGTATDEGQNQVTPAELAELCTSLNAWSQQINQKRPVTETEADQETVCAFNEECARYNTAKEAYDKAVSAYNASPIFAFTEYIKADAMVKAKRQAEQAEKTAAEAKRHAAMAAAEARRRARQTVLAAAREDFERRQSTFLCELEKQLKLDEKLFKDSLPAFSKSAKRQISGNVFIVTKEMDVIRMALINVCIYSLDAVALDRKLIRQFMGFYRFEQDVYDHATEPLKNAVREDYRNSGWYENDVEAKIDSELAAIRSGRPPDPEEPSRFCFLQHPPLDSIKTDADGKFLIQAPANGKYVLCAKAERLVNGSYEHYGWIAVIPPIDGPIWKITLSNDNLCMGAEFLAPDK